MRRQIVFVLCWTVLALMTSSPNALAQQKTVKACQEEWRANKAANQANGVTEKAYVAQCRGGAAPAQTTAAPAAPPAPVSPTQTATGEKTAKACRDEWRANKAANQANGVTEKAYVAQCRGGAAPAQTTAAPAAPPAPVSPTQTATEKKTAKACRDEWRANKAANQANGVTEKAYVAQCRGGAAPAQTTAAPAAPPAPVSPTQTATGEKTAKACRDEWRANKAANQANGVTEKAYVAQCRGGAAPAQTTAAPAPPAPAPKAAPASPAPAPTAAAPPTKPASSPTSAATPASTSPAKPAGANEFSTEAQAKARCPGDTVVWVNLASKIYHFSGTKSYGATKKGAYMCERVSVAEGMRAAKNETHP